MTATIHPFDQFLEFVGSLQRQGAKVEAHPDPNKPGRIAYYITGPSAAVVQNAVADRMEEAERACGLARFTLPQQVGGEWAAVGEVRTGAAV